MDKLLTLKQSKILFKCFGYMRHRLPLSQFDTDLSETFDRLTNEQFGFRSSKRYLNDRKHYRFIIFNMRDMGFTDLEIKKEWVRVYCDHKKLPNYSTMPSRVRKDNGKVRNTGTGGSNFNSVRVPSLRRNKNVWINFYLLFPSYYEKMMNGKSGLKFVESSRLIKLNKNE